MKEIKAMNELATLVREEIEKSGYKFNFVATQCGVSRQSLYQTLNKKNFSESDANKILAVLNKKIEASYSIIDK